MIKTELIKRASNAVPANANGVKPVRGDPDADALAHALGLGALGLGGGGLAGYLTAGKEDSAVDKLKRVLISAGLGGLAGVGAGWAMPDRLGKPSGSRFIPTA